MRREPRVGSIKMDKDILHKISPILVLEKTLEREREREKLRFLFGDSWGFVGRKLSSLELKFFVSMRATCRHQKGGISSKIHRRRFGEIKGFEFRKCFKASYGFYYSPRGRDSSYFGLFSILGAVWLSFNALRGCLTK